MIWKTLLVILITFIPFLELRLAIPLGILNGIVKFPFGISFQGFNLNPFLIIPLVIASNILLGMILFFILEKIGKKFVNRPKYKKFLEKRKLKIKKYVDKYGILELSLFIGIPIPGSGVYSGTLGAFLIGMKKRDFYISNLIGVLIAGIIVSIITLIARGIL